MAARLAEIVRRMMDHGWKPPDAVSEARLGAVEAELGIVFPSDYRRFILEAGGSPRGGARWGGLWSVDEVASLNRSLPLFQWFRGVVGIGNEGFVVYALDFRRSGAPPVVSVGMSASDPEDIQVEGDSFSEWLERTVPHNG